MNPPLPALCFCVVVGYFWYPKMVEGKENNWLKSGKNCSTLVAKTGFSVFSRALSDILLLLMFIKRWLLFFLLLMMTYTVTTLCREDILSSLLICLSNPLNIVLMSYAWLWHFNLVFTRQRLRYKRRKKLSTMVVNAFSNHLL